MYRLDQKLARIRSGKYKKSDFIIADAKDGDMGPSLTSSAPKRAQDGSWTRYHTREEFLDNIQAIIEQDIVDIMLVSASNLEKLTDRGVFKKSKVKPAIRANDTTDIWVMRGATYSSSASKPFRSASLAHVMTAGGGRRGGKPLTNLGLYSITFNNHLEADHASLEAFREFRNDCQDNDFTYFLEVFNPNIKNAVAPEVMPHYVNDCILRCLAGLTKAERPEFLKIAYNGPKALEELASFDPSLTVGVLGGGAGTTRDCFELIYQAEKYGARVALFGRKINLAESPLAMVKFMRAVASGDVKPEEAVRAYHAFLKKEKITSTRSLEDDLLITEVTLKG